jgi:ABC-2 type transport system ATP-binding protein
VNRDPMIELRQVSRQFAGVTAVDRLSLTVYQGEIFGLVGPDGAGKTTTLRMICGLMNPSEGEIRVAGLNVIRNLAQVKDRIGYMAQKFGLYGDLTVEENMFFYADLFAVTGRARDELVHKLLAMTRMSPFRRRQSIKLSGGMKQKLALMCTLLHHPQLLILDEPTNGVDPVSRRDFWVILRQLAADGLTVLTTTAYLDEAERCDRVGMMDRGRLLLMDTPRALRHSLAETCFEIRGGNLRSIRDALRDVPGIVSVDLAGSALHVLAEAGMAETDIEAHAPGAEVRRIVPALEDVFIRTVQMGAGRGHA